MTWKDSIRKESPLDERAGLSNDEFREYDTPTKEDKETREYLELLVKELSMHIEKLPDILSNNHDLVEKAISNMELAISSLVKMDGLATRLPTRLLK